MDYEYLDEGKIIVVNNLRFEDGTLDHSWNKGRPCLILFEDDEYEYIVPIKSELKDESYFEEIYYINNDSMLYFYHNYYVETTLKPNKYNKGSNKLMRNSKGKKNIEGFINLKSIYKVPIAFRNEVGKLDYDTYKSIIEKLHKIQKTKNNEELKEKAFNAR